MPTMDNNVTPLVLRYREAARHLWNVFLREEATFGTGTLPVAMLDDWDALKDLLFTALVLRHTGREAHAAARLLSPESLAFLRVVPTSPEVPAMISRHKPAGGYWDHPVCRLGPKDDLRFIDFFDFDQSGFLDFQYYRVSINGSDAADLVGRDALIEVQYAHVYVEDPAGSGGPRADNA